LPNLDYRPNETTYRPNKVIDGDKEQHGALLCVIPSTSWRRLAIIEARYKTMSTDYDSSWDEDNDELWEQMYDEWEKRDWESWLSGRLSFPFEVKREEDDDEAYFTNVASRQPFRLGHTMEVLGIEGEHVHYGILVKVREGRRTGRVPLCDVEVTSRSDPNFWPVREYVVWFANR
jgi:hypothetical protein